MSQSRFYRDLLITGIIILNLGLVLAVVHKPRGEENKIKLNITGKERIYYELDDEGLLYKGVGKQFELGDSIRIGFHSRTIKAPTGKKRRNYGFTIQIDDNTPEKLQYKKSGSKVTSADRPGWIYTESGVWYVYLPVKKQGYIIKVQPLKGNPVVYLRITSNDLIKEGKFSDGLRTVNRQDRWRIETRKDPFLRYITTTYWYPLLGNEQQQYEISGPASVRMFTRVQFENDDKEQDYYIRIREDGYDLGTYYFKSEISDKSYVAKTQNSVGKWRSVWLSIPKGSHYYTFTLPDINDNREQSVFIRIKEWEEEQ